MFSRLTCVRKTSNKQARIEPESREDHSRSESPANDGGDEAQDNATQRSHDKAQDDDEPDDDIQSESRVQNISLTAAKKELENVAGPVRRTQEQSQERRVYETLDIDEFRLLELQPGANGEPLKASLRALPLSESLEHTALSYTWGSSQPPYWIELDGGQFQITQSLNDALIQLRSPDVKSPLWVDAICINQGDAKEKSSQIMKMREIFAGADKLHIWMGHPDSPGDDQGAIDLLMKLKGIFTDEGSVDELLMEPEHYHVGDNPK